jgi:hypothetical protein
MAARHAGEVLEMVLTGFDWQSIYLQPGFGAGALDTKLSRFAFTQRLQSLGMQGMQNSVQKTTTTR